MDERLAKTIAAIRASGADWGIFTSPDGVAYASGHIVAIEAGPSPFAGGPAIAVVGKNGECGLVVTNLEAGTQSWAEPILTYEGFSYKSATDIFANYCDTVGQLFKKLGVSGTVAIEEASFPLSLLPMIETCKRVSIGDAFKRERMIKTSTEIALLREAALTASAGQRSFLDKTRAGRTELEVFADIRLAMESRAGERLPLTGDFISGKERTSEFMGWPTNRMIQTGDPLICDLAPRVNGYWGDSCASAMLGKPSARFEKQFKAAKSALDLAIEIIRPGLGIGELDQRLQAHIAAHGYSYAHHSGHSIGTSVHEWPRLVGYETESFKRDMVVMVEPTAFDPEIGGVRLEFMLHVTENGCDVLTDFEHQLSIG
ncbi:Xaa-Pro peptidase family protein [Brucella sp. 21LCYQ03]|nr:Xaa-Pro peptidase family protein [Brucella sp. 21LCYQ03]